MESYDRTMECYRVGSLATADENSLEAIYEICLLVANATGSMPQHRINRLRVILENTKIGLFYLQNWDIPAEKLPPYTLVIIGEEIGPGDHIRLYDEFMDHTESMDKKALEAHLARCASLITKESYHLFAILMSELLCDPDTMIDPEYERIEWFFKRWWGLKEEPFQVFNQQVYGDEGLWMQIWALGEDLEVRIQEVEESEDFLDS